MSTQASLYKILATQLETAIRDGKWKPGQQLPTEAELMKIHKLSRVTVRGALTILRSKKLIETFPHRGSIVLDQTAGIGVRNLDSIEEIVRLGRETQTEILEWQAIEPPSKAAEFFGHKHRAIYRLQGIRSRLDARVYFICSYVREDFGEKITREELMTQTPIEIIKNKLKVSVLYATEEVWIEHADGFLAEQLGTNESSLIVVEEMRIYGKNGLPLQMSTAWWKPEHYRRRYTVTQ